MFCNTFQQLPQFYVVRKPQALVIFLLLQDESYATECCITAVLPTFHDTFELLLSAKQRVSSLHFNTRDCWNVYALDMRSKSYQFLYRNFLNNFNVLLVLLYSLLCSASADHSSSTSMDIWTFLYKHYLDDCESQHISLLIYNIINGLAR